MKQFFIALDQLLNTAIWIKGDGFGWADETLSARAYRIEKRGGTSIPRKIIDTLFFFDEYHCEESYYSEVNRKHLPRHYH